MHHDASGKVDMAPLHEQTLWMPRHVGQWTVDHKEEKHHEEHIGRETHTFGKRPCNQRRGDDGKLHLKQGIESQWNSGST